MVVDCKLFFLYAVECGVYCFAIFEYITNLWVCENNRQDSNFGEECGGLRKMQ